MRYLLYVHYILSCLICTQQIYSVSVCTLHAKLSQIELEPQDDLGVLNVHVVMIIVGLTKWHMLNCLGLIQSYHQVIYLFVVWPYYFIP